jgi:hypothetical protein
MAKQKLGKYIVPAGRILWPHEEKTAQSLVRYGHIIEFIPEIDRDHEGTPDAYIDDEPWEFKAPKGHTLDVVGRNLRRASRKADSIVFDSRRMKKIPDKAISRELSTQLHFIAKIRRIKFVDRSGNVVDIT